MKRFMPLFLAPALAISACDSDGGTTNNTTDTSTSTDTSTGGDTNTGGGDTGPSTDTGGGGSATQSELTGVETNVSVTPVTPNASCDASEVDNTDHGATYPFGGLEVEGTSYTCNKCPNGNKELQGSWRTHGWKADNEDEVDYSIGSEATDANVLLVDGNTFSYEVRQTDGANYIARGYYVCTQKPEHPNEHIFWQVVETEPANVLGTPDVPGLWRTDVVLNSGPDNILLFWFAALTGDQQYSLGYCRVGSTVGDQTCNNPLP